MHQDGSSSARARSARIRASHDYEATELESMRRKGRALDERKRPRPALMSRVTAAFARAGRWNAPPARPAASERDEAIARVNLNE